jgi:hypothetical protein
MEQKIVYENEDKNKEIIPVDNKTTFQNSLKEMKGSESSLKSINNITPEIIHSSVSSINPIGKSMNSNNSNEYNNINSNNIINNLSDKSQSNNINNQFDLYNSDLDESKDTIMKIFESTIEKQKIINSNQINNQIKLENIGNQQISHSNKDRKLKSVNDDELKLKVKEKMNKGFIPFFVKAEGYDIVFYYGKPNCKLKIYIEDYIKKVNVANNIENNFYYNNKLVDLNSTLRQIKLKPLKEISIQLHK